MLRHMQQLTHNASMQRASLSSLVGDLSLSPHITYPHAGGIDTHTHMQLPFMGAAPP